MGWFLSRSHPAGRRKKKSKRTPAAASRKTAAAWDPRRTLLAVKVIVALVAVAGVVYGWGRLERALLDYASRTRTGPAVVELVRRPAWMSDSTAAQLRQDAAAYITDDPMDRVGLVKTAAALRDNPWVAHVDQVRRSADGRVLVEADYRRPAALIRTDAGFYVVDATGVWLPTGDREHLRDLPVITGVTSRRPRHEGEAWTGEDAAAALALATTLRHEPYLDQVTSIDASARDAMGRVKLVLYSREGWVVWGLAPGQEKMVEPEARVKLDRLRRIVRAKGTLASDSYYLNGATILTASASASGG